MARRYVIRSRCSLCGEEVEQVADGMLRSEPHYHNAEYVFTHSGYKQYIHSSCWYGMIEEQKQLRKEMVNHG